MTAVTVKITTCAEKVRSCVACQLGRGRCVPGEGAMNAKIMLVGQAPGIQENRQGRPFIGPAGQFLRSTLADVGLPLDQCYFTNIVKGYPGKGQGGDKAPTSESIKKCLAHLKVEIEAIKPAIVVALGAVPMHALGIPGGIIKNAGRTFETEYGPTVPVLHPAGLWRQPRNTLAFKTQLSTLKRFIVP